MKKIKFLGTAILAASLLLAGCSSPVDDVVEDDDTTVTLSPEDDGTTSGGGTTTGGNPSGGGSTSGGSNEPVINYTAPDLTGYYKKYLISATETVNPVTMESWDAVSTNTPNADGTLSIVPGTKWGSSTSCVAFTGFEAGSLANYDYIVFTLDTTDFSFKYDEEDADNRNDGVNIKIPEVMRELATKCVINGKKRTYYAQVSSFGEAPINAVQFALIIGGTGTLKIDEVYLAASEDPATKAVTGITITPASATVAQGGSQQFTVKDSKFVNLTNDENVAYTISGDAAVGSTISDNGLLTAGTKAGNLTVTATYTVGDKSFTSSATITVMGAMTNLVNSVALEKYIDSTGANNEVVTLENGVATVAKPAGTTGWGAWSSQLFLTVSSENGNVFETGKKYYISVTLESDADLNGCIWKGDDAAGYLLEENIALIAGESKTLVKEVEFTAGFEKFQCILAFGANANAANITVSNITVYDITPQVK